MFISISHLKNLALESVKVDNWNLFSIINLTVFTFINGAMENSAVRINVSQGLKMLQNLAVIRDELLYPENNLHVLHI